MDAESMNVSVGPPFPGPNDPYRERLERALRRIARTNVDAATQPEQRDLYAVKVLRAVVDLARAAVPDWSGTGPEDISET